MPRHARNYRNGSIHPGDLAVAALLCLSLILTAGTLQAADSVTPGTLTTPYPTVTNLAVEWEISGDDNLNCTAEVSYRAAGGPIWRQGMPLRRIPAGQSIATSPALPLEKQDVRQSVRSAAGDGL